MSDPVLPSAAPDGVAIRSASTIVFVRDAPDGAPGVEVLMLRRAPTASFAGDAYVFPGGAVDAADSSLAFESCCDLDDERASARMGLELGGLAFWIAAIRESFEESGILLASHAGSGERVSFDDPVLGARFDIARHEVHDGRLGLAQLCERERLVLTASDVHYISRWIAPADASRRFDAHFFLAAAPPGQSPMHDDREIVASLWIRPRDALDRRRAGELRILPPTIAMLELVAPHASAMAAVAAASQMPLPQPSRAEFLRDEAGVVTDVVINGNVYEMRRLG